MKLKRRSIIIVALIVAIGVALGFYVAANNDQSYGEKKASQLIDETQENKSQEADNGVDTNANKANKDLQQKGLDGQKESKANAVSNKTNTSSKSNKNQELGNQPMDGSNSKSEDKGTKPSHVHTWIPVYANRQVAHETQEEHEICNQCGEDLTGLSDDAFYEHFENGTCGGFHSKWVIKTTYTTEKYISQYKCSCGATKN